MGVGMRYERVERYRGASFERLQKLAEAGRLSLAEGRGEGWLRCC